MTGQVSDEFRYNSETYALVGIDGEGLYTAHDLGLEARPASTACWRGYQMVYDCRDGKLVLDMMNVNTHNPISINGVEPTKGDWMFSHIYENLNLQTKFTGSILLGKDFIDAMYVHMGFQSAESYRTVIEIEVKDGFIIRETDVSSTMEERRRSRKGKPTAPPSMEDDDIHSWIVDRFSQDYKSDE
ncbi:MAG: hypothetical protein JW779_02005 [Candidatus Thorarchaeota archaeon]|nr:hypothetical protein [Candidatus Thorarchaeota archaeon]